MPLLNTTHKPNGHQNVSESDCIWPLKRAWLCLKAQCTPVHSRPVVIPSRCILWFVSCCPRLVHRFGSTLAGLVWIAASEI